MMKVMHIARAAGLGLGALLLSTTAQAAGFQINEHSAINTGRASSVVATVKDASAIWHNPAGLTNIKGTSLQVGVNFIRAAGNYEGGGPRTTNSDFPNNTTADLDGRFRPVPNVYAARELSSKAYVGLGFYAPYGSGITWDGVNDYVGRTLLVEQELRAFFITPAIALKLTDNVSVAVGVSLVPATAYLKQTLGAIDTRDVLFPRNSPDGEDGFVEVSGSAFGVGANAGLQLTLIDNLKIGLAFRSAVDLSFDGDANFTLPDGAPLDARTRFSDTKGTLDITLPHTFLFGIGWDQGDFTIEASTQLTLWNSYDELRLDFDPAEGAPAGDPGLPDSASPRNWEIVPMFRLGAQYMATDDLAVRLGVGYDMSPVPDETADFTLPDNDRIFFTVGAGYNVFDYVSIDVAYMGLYLMGRELPADGNLTLPIVNGAGGKFNGGLAHVISTTLSTSF